MFSRHGIDWHRGALLQGRPTAVAEGGSRRRYERANTRATATTESATNRASLGNQAEVRTRACSKDDLSSAGITPSLLIRGPNTRSCESVRTSRTATRAILTFRATGQSFGLRDQPRWATSRGPVLSRRTMALQTKSRNRLAASRNKAMKSGAAFRLLTSGARTSERNNIPPIQPIAARRCIQSSSR